MMNEEIVKLDSIRVDRIEEKWLSLDKLSPFPGNPRERTEKVLRQLVAAITTHGFLGQVSVWGNSDKYNYSPFVILGGHRRLDALNYIIKTGGKGSGGLVSRRAARGGFVPRGLRGRTIIR